MHHPLILLWDSLVSICSYERDIATVNIDGMNLQYHLKLCDEKTKKHIMDNSFKNREKPLYYNELNVALNTPTFYINKIFTRLHCDESWIFQQETLPDDVIRWYFRINSRDVEITFGFSGKIQLHNLISYKHQLVHCRIEDTGAIMGGDTVNLSHITTAPNIWMITSLLSQFSAETLKRAAYIIQNTPAYIIINERIEWELHYTKGYSCFGMNENVVYEDRESAGSFSVVEFHNDILTILESELT